MYSKAFYDSQADGSEQSAREIVPHVLQLLNPASVVDVGCGVGTWLKVYKEHGIKEVLGLDGDYVDRSMLRIDGREFLPTDLSTPFHLDRQFDLVQTLEVAEHIDRDNAAVFVQNLVAHGKAVLFSAAVPYQLGTGHVNEQYIGYWADLFGQHTYQLVDFIRPAIWDNPGIEAWYRQNLVLFVEESMLNAHPNLRELAARPATQPLSIIHPEIYAERVAHLLGVIKQQAFDLHKQGNSESARKLYDLLINYDGNSPDVWSAYGQLGAQHGQWDLAVHCLEKAAALAPDKPECVFNLGQAYAMQGDVEKARYCFTKALAISPGFEPARQALGALPPGG